MKKFFLRIGLFFLIVALVDATIGKVLGVILEKATVTDFGRDNYICNISQDDLLVFGSSRAVHHYNTDMIKDSLGINCYNCGEDGQGILLNYGRLLMNVERHQPKIIIYDVIPEYDIWEGDNYRYMKWLKPHYERTGVAEIVKSIDSNEPYKLYSHLYRYNSEFILLLVSLLHMDEQPLGTGYVPLYASMEEIKVNDTKEEITNNVDALKLEYLNRFIDIADNCGSKLIFVVSPTWYGMKSNELKIIKEICTERNISFFDFSNDSKYVHNNVYFKDGMHLNSKGADEFTKDLLKRIDEL